LKKDKKSAKKKKNVFYKIKRKEKEEEGVGKQLTKGYGSNWAIIFDRFEDGLL
jgi:hypothetical protein